MGISVHTAGQGRGQYIVVARRVAGRVELALSCSHCLDGSIRPGKYRMMSSLVVLSVQYSLTPTIALPYIAGAPLPAMEFPSDYMTLGRGHYRYHKYLHTDSQDCRRIAGCVILLLLVQFLLSDRSVSLGHEFLPSARAGVCNDTVAVVYVYSPGVAYRRS